MTKTGDSTAFEKAARRRISDFERRWGKGSLHLAYHAALPVALNADLLHMLRINFFLDPPEILPYTAEADFLLSSLCHEVGEDLYEVDSKTRDLLLQGLIKEYGLERIRDVATLLWEYCEKYASWDSRVELLRAQQLTALNFLDPLKARQWLEEAGRSPDRGSSEREWFVAMDQDLQRQSYLVTRSQKAPIGTQVGNYRIIAPIGIGSYASVYRANHVMLTNRVVALKILHMHLAEKECEGFVQEVQLLEGLRHRYILSLYDAGIDNDMPYLATEYAPNGSLRHLLNQTAPGLLNREHALTILTQVGEALDYIHQNNVIHCNLEPENILFNAQGAALLADFGIATILSTAPVKHLVAPDGSAAYMAPERFRGLVSKEGDQYSLGCIAYELFTGQRVFSASNFVSMGFKHAQERPRSLRSLVPSVPVHIEQAILKALAKERKERHADVMAFIHALKAPHSPEVNEIASEMSEVLLLSKQMHFISQAHHVSIETSIELYRQEKYTESLIEIYSIIEAIINMMLLEAGEIGNFKRLAEKIQKLVQKGIIPHDDTSAMEVITAERNKIVHGNFVDATKESGSSLCLLAFRYLRKLLTAYRPIAGQEGETKLDPFLWTSLQDRAQYQQAELLYQQAMSLQEQTSGSGHTVLSYSLHALGMLAQVQGEYERAQEYYERALRIKEQALPAAHPDTGATLHALGTLAQAQGEYERAQEYYERALRIKEQALPATHPDTATSLHNLATLYEAQGKYHLAEPLFQRALAICEQALGPDHPNTQKVRRWYDSLLKKMGTET